MVTLELAWDIGTDACKLSSTFPVAVVCTLALADDFTTEVDLYICIHMHVSVYVMKLVL
jgi:hypothetical protein